MQKLNVFLFVFKGIQLNKTLKMTSFYSALQWDMREQIESILGEGFDPNGKEDCLTHFQSIILSVLEAPLLDEFVEFRVELIFRLRKMGGKVSEGDILTHLDALFRFSEQNFNEKGVQSFERILAALVHPLE